ncbi:MAG: hypothetical protein CM15mP18_3440 [Methanobacteriota archaeon]|nr:MAG: hypothetical protein CM15mP18_3440 [Euryarchaeota archaeon]
MDRFLMKMSMGYPDRAEEKAILARRKMRGKDAPRGGSGHGTQEGRRHAARARGRSRRPSILAYIVEIVQRTREDHRVVNGASPRASQALFKTGRASAAIAGRTYVVPDDIKSVAMQVISHRIVETPEARFEASPAVTSFVRS